MFVLVREGLDAVSGPGEVSIARDWLVRERRTACSGVLLCTTVVVVFVGIGVGAAAGVVVDGGVVVVFVVVVVELT